MTSLKSQDVVEQGFKSQAVTCPLCCLNNWDGTYMQSCLFTELFSHILLVFSSMSGNIRVY